MALVAAAAVAQAGCGGSGSGTSTTLDGSAPTHTLGDVVTTTTSPGGGGEASRGDGPPGQRGGVDPYSEAAGSSESALVQSVRAYVSAIDRRDGATVCELLGPGVLRSVRLPREAAGCAESVRASIGYHPAGGAAWQGTEIRRIGPVELDPENPGEGRVRATVVHRFGGGREPSIEDDLIYLRYRAGRWLIAKPSSTFYRAIGAQNVPLRALTPP